jgi:hypothetical protein
MARCISCSEELQPAWKFCIYCGHKVEPVPAAIRPDATTEAPRRHVTALALFGWGLAGLLAVIAVVAVVLFNQ